MDSKNITDYIYNFIYTIDMIHYSLFFIHFNFNFSLIHFILIIVSSYIC